MRTGNVILQSYKNEAPLWTALQQLPMSPTTCATACGGSREVGRDDPDAQEQPLVHLADLLGRHRGLLKRALRRMRRSCLHQLVLRLLEVDPSTTTGAEDASWLQREQQVVASSVEGQIHE